VVVVVVVVVVVAVLVTVRRRRKIQRSHLFQRHIFHRAHLRAYLRLQSLLWYEPYRVSKYSWLSLILHLKRVLHRLPPSQALFFHRHVTFES